jgi:hypothetical protein
MALVQLDVGSDRVIESRPVRLRNGLIQELRDLRSVYISRHRERQRTVSVVAAGAPVLVLALGVTTSPRIVPAEFSY